MAEFTADIAAEVVAACQAGASEAAEGLQRAFDNTYEVQPGEAGEFNLEELAEEFSGPGLVFILKVDDVAALLVVAESSGLIPDWYAQPDATGASRLATLAQELGMVLLPEEHMPLEFLAGRVDNLAEALQRADVSENPGWVPLTLNSGEHSGVLHIIWPVAKPDDVIVESESTDEASEPEVQETTSTEEIAPSSESAVPSGGQHTHQNFAEGLQLLPPYARSLLRIKVPVIVTLATTKQPVSRILELGPGSIIQFEKSCDETLSLEVGDQSVAVGEAVKVGDMFGLRITSVTMPEERFFVVKGKRDAASDNQG